MGYFWVYNNYSLLQLTTRENIKMMMFKFNIFTMYCSLNALSLGSMIYDTISNTSTQKYCKLAGKEILYHVSPLTVDCESQSLHFEKHSKLYFGLKRDFLVRFISH